MIQNYIAYLIFIDEKLSKFFERQKPYICCKKGCGKCCQNAQFPYSQIEIVYLLQGASKLDDEKINIIMNNINAIKEKKENFSGEKFLYDCPFLIDNQCSVYPYRGVICRSFGLMNISENGKVKVPFCCFDGYNYSNVMEDDGTNVSAEKFQKLGIKEEPLAFHTDYQFLTDSDFEKMFHFKFGDKKPMIEWLMNFK